MKCCTSWVTTVVAVAGLAVVGIGGFNWYTTGCPTGRCADQGAALTPASATTEEKACCALHQAAAEATTKDACHESTACTESKATCADKAAVVNASNTECCKGKSAEECCKTTGKGCDSACGEKKSCSEKTECGEKTEKKQANDPA